jgi:prevent-host-death family protein
LENVWNGNRSAAEFQCYFGLYQDEALTKPVVITRNGRERLVMISVDEYRRLRRSDRQVLRSGELPDADFAALEETRAPESSSAFDDEVKSV